MGERDPYARLRLAALPALAAVLVATSTVLPQNRAAQAPPSQDPALAVFSAWLSENHPGYGCDEGPARFRNKTVEAAYSGQRFYYVLTYARGIQPPFANSVSLVAAIDDEGRVIPFTPRSPASYGKGLKRMASSKDVRMAAAAVSIVASCDPGERRWAFKPDLFKVKKTAKVWKATYSYDNAHSSWVTFDRKGAVVEFGGTAPPVP
jgi:hypothetical protein